MIGAQMKLYVGAAADTEAATEVAKVRDNEMPLKASEVDASSRAGGGWKDFVQGLKEWGAGFDVLYDPTDAGWLILQTAMMSGAKISVAILDGPTATGKGIKGKAIVSDFTRGEPLDGHPTNKVTLKGCGAPTSVD